MLTQEIEHLEVILNKKPIIGTWSAQDLIERPEMVRENYLEHVRSFVVLNRVSSNEDDLPTVEDYEKRLLKLVKDREAAKGFITAEYGYGKTSTALFIWNRCEEANIVAVPPFQIQQLHHLISATYGWVRFKLSVSYPALTGECDAIYQKYVSRDIETHGQNESERAALRRAWQEGRYSLDLRPLDYVRFFEEMTALVERANFKGLVVLADELQQYIDPDIKAGVKDPITPLFDIIQALITRRGQLSFALLFSIPTKELGLINDQRGDLVHRLKGDKLALDLTALYNPRFARDLWFQLADVLQFQSLRDKIIEPEALEALGQISARSDLATGPRTVVDVFNLVTRRYKAKPDGTQPFSPLDLVNAFLSGEISYDNTGKLQQVINGHLNHEFVQRKPEYQKAIKLMAAFPVDGLSDSLFDRYGVRSAIAELTGEAQGDIVTYMGGGVDEYGQPRPYRAMLVGLEERKINTDWLSTTLREFTRNYVENSPRMRALVMQGFRELLRTEIFKSGTWKESNSYEATLTQNHSVVYEGAFGTTAKRFPNRRLHLRLIGVGETLRENNITGDLALNFELLLHGELPEKDRRNVPGEISYPQDKVTTFRLNLSHNSERENYGDLHNTLGPMVSPWKITPALLLSLYAYLNERRAANAIPKADDEFIRSNFQPILLEHALNELFNQELGAVFNAAQARIVEEAVRRELERHYSQYKTLMGVSQWRQNLRDYAKALEGLPTPFERQGVQVFEKSGTELAKLFAKTGPSTETFISNHPLFIQKAPNGYRFILHPLENKLLGMVKGSSFTKPPVTGSDKPRHYLKSEIALKAAMQLGYREEEYEEALKLLEARGMLSLNAGRTELIEEHNRVLSVNELRDWNKELGTRLSLVKTVLPDNPQLAKWLKDFEAISQMLKILENQPDESRQSSLLSSIKARQHDIDLLIEGKRREVEQNLAKRVQKGFNGKLNCQVLEKPIEPVLFGQQLEAQRNALLKLCQDSAAQVEPLKQRLADLVAVAGQSPLPDEDLSRLLQDHKQLNNDIYQYEERQAKLGVTLGYYERSRALLNTAQGLEQRISSVPADLRDAFSDRLQGWSLEVTGALSSAKLQALEHYATWDSDFEVIKREFDERLGAERARFQGIQQDYRNYLSQEFPQVPGWAEVVYNQTEPQDSYNRLWESVHEVFKQAIEHIRHEVQSVYDRAVRLQGGSINQLPPADRPQAQAALNEAIITLTELLSSTGRWVAAVNKANFMDPVRSSGANTQAEQMLKRVMDTIHKLNSNLPTPVIDEIEQRVNTSTLTPQEEGLMQTLQAISSGNASTGVELGLLLQQSGAVDNQSAAWQILEKLYSKGRLRIQIAPVNFNNPE
ncbi:MAG TPA: hypothetical protein VH186_22005 [Chloroflexia bacterium]|nr:hypothetical protein [Chloroflexia bacterium]